MIMHDDDAATHKCVAADIPEKNKPHKPNVTISAVI